MNVFGLVYVQAKEGISLSELKVGIWGTDAATFGKYDILEIAVKADSPILDSDAREYIEHLQATYNY